jgi:lipoprotein-anchoring transpeptidase ErfK/SrfK
VLALVVAAVVVLLGAGGHTAVAPVVGPVAAPAPAVPAPVAPAGIADRAACPPEVVACVDLRTRQSWLQRDGAVVYGPVPFLPGDETGRVPPGPTSSATPTGLFHVGRKNADQVSSEFDEPMPHAVFFAPGGIAFHQGSLAGSSHGCVHLDAAAATAYFDHLRHGDEVLVFS